MTNGDKTWDDETKYDNPVADESLIQEASRSKPHGTPPDPASVAANLVEMYQPLLSSPMRKKGKEWNREDWPGREPDQTWSKVGVYMLWASEDDPKVGVPPVYVGVGQIGWRVGESFHKRKTWYFAQVLADYLISGDDLDSRFWRKALERFCIVVLQPTENKD